MSQNKVIAYIKGPGQQKALALSALIVLYVFFCIFGSNFASLDTLISIFDSSYYTGFMAIGMTLVIISGGIDLSVGTVTVGSALIGGVAYNVWGLPMWFCLILIVLTGTIFGIMNGILIGKLNLPPFIATLGAQFISMGLCSVVAKVQTMRYPSITSPDGWFKTVFFKTRSGFPMGAIWLLLLFAVAVIILNRTKLGNYTYAIGDNEETVRLSGINTSNWKLLIYTVSGFCCGLAGIIYAATFTSITPQTGGGQEMYAIAACVIGGASLSGGIGSLTGTIIGVVVVAAVLVDVIRNKRAMQAR
jgi:Ribose/xylose/arabinose/galactoside ABC-type transport systems, permease components